MPLSLSLSLSLSEDASDEELSLDEEDELESYRKRGESCIASCVRRGRSSLVLAREPCHIQAMPSIHGHGHGHGGSATAASERENRKHGAGCMLRFSSCRHDSATYV